MKQLLRHGPAALRGLISANLAIVLAVIMAGAGALAYEWWHAQAVKRAQTSLVAHHHKRYVANPAATH
jgi:hypothetical protein